MIEGFNMTNTDENTQKNHRGRKTESFSFLAEKEQYGQFINFTQRHKASLGQKLS